VHQIPCRIIRNNSHVATIFRVLAGWAGVEAGLIFAVQIFIIVMYFKAHGELRGKTLFPSIRAYKI
jgi:hypothetical protein